MSTEDQLIQRLRILYGIGPATANAQSFDDQIRDLQAQAARLAPTVVLHTTGRGNVRSSKTVTNPEISKTQDRIRDLQAKRIAAPDQSLTSEAEHNRATLEGVFGGIKRSTLDEGTRDLNSRFTDTLRSNNARLASRGLTNGSQARSTQGRTLTELLTGRQRLAGAADAADQTARQTLDEQRQTTERQIKLGTQPDVASIDALRNAQTGVNQAYNGLTQQALGGLLVRGADTYRDTNQADASGRRGWGTVAPSAGRASSTGGRVY